MDHTFILKHLPLSPVVSHLKAHTGSSVSATVHLTVPSTSTGTRDKLSEPVYFSILYLI